MRVTGVAAPVMRMRMRTADFNLHMLAAVAVRAVMPVMYVVMAGVAAIATFSAFPSTTAAFSAIIAVRHGFGSMQMRDRPEGGKALIISIRRLDFLAIADRAGRGGERRGEKTDAQQTEQRDGASKILHPLSVAPVLFWTSAMILAAIASISASVRVLSRGCRVTAIAIDFLPGGISPPS